MYAFSFAKRYLTGSSSGGEDIEEGNSIVVDGANSDDANSDKGLDFISLARMSALPPMEEIVSVEDIPPNPRVMGLGELTITRSQTHMRTAIEYQMDVQQCLDKSMNFLCTKLGLLRSINSLLMLVYQQRDNGGHIGKYYETGVLPPFEHLMLQYKDETSLELMPTILPFCSFHKLCRRSRLCKLGNLLVLVPKESDQIYVPFQFYYGIGLTIHESSPLVQKATTPGQKIRATKCVAGERFKMAFQLFEYMYKLKDPPSSVPVSSSNTAVVESSDSKTSVVESENYDATRIAPVDEEQLGGSVDKFVTATTNSNVGPCRFTNATESVPQARRQVGGDQQASATRTASITTVDSEEDDESTVNPNEVRQQVGGDQLPSDEDDESPVNPHDVRKQFGGDQLASATRTASPPVTTVDSDDDHRRRGEQIQEIDVSGGHQHQQLVGPGQFIGTSNDLLSLFRGGGTISIGQLITGNINSNHAAPAPAPAPSSISDADIDRITSRFRDVMREEAPSIVADATASTLRSTGYAHVTQEAKDEISTNLAGAYSTPAGRHPPGPPPRPPRSPLVQVNHNSIAFNVGDQVYSKNLKDPEGPGIIEEKTAKGCHVRFPGDVKARFRLNTTLQSEPRL